MKLLNQAQEVTRLLDSLKEREQTIAQLTFQANLLAHVHDAVLAFDKNFILTSWNQAAEKIYGWKAEEVIGRSGGEMLRSEFMGIPRDEAIRTLRESGKLEVELIQHCKDDSKVWIDSRTIAMREERGDIIGYVSVNRDITERKRAEKELQLSREFAEHLIQTANVIYLQLDGAGNVQRINAAAEEITGYSEGELEGKSWFETLVPRDRYPYVWEEFARITNPGEIPKIFENPILSKQGEERRILWKNNVIWEEDTVVATVSFGIDITEHKRAERRAAELSAFTEKILASSPVGFLTYKFTGECVSANESAADIVGATVEQLKSQNFHTLESWKRSGFYMLAETAIATRETQIADIHLVSTFGKEMWITAQFVVFESEGEPHLLLTIQDISGRKQAAQALQESENRMAGIVDAAMDGIISINADQKIVLANPAAELIFGYSVNELIGKSLDILIPQQLREIHHLHIEQFGRTGVTTRSMGALTVATGLRATGEEFPLEASISQITVGDLKQFTVILRDITERKRAEAKIKRQLEHLSALHTVDATIRSSFDLHITLNIILDQVTTELGVDAADILLFKAQTLIYADGRGFRGTGNQRTRLRLGEGFAGRAVLELKPVYITNLDDTGGDFARAMNLEKDGFVAYYGMPLVAKGQVKGVLEVFHRSPLTLNEDGLAFLETLANQAAIAIHDLQLFAELQRSNIELSLAYETTLEGWVHALDLRDKETEGHTQRVTDLTLRLAGAMSFSEEELVHIRRGALLHDIGKLGIPDRILLKPGPLTDEEWDIMRQHPVYAYEWLSPITYLRPALEIPYCHHEKWDGSGYPRGLRRDTIPLAARIFAIVDVWDALRSDRPYRAAWSEEKVIDHVRSLAGTHFDPQVVEVFLRVVGEREGREI